MGIDAGGDFGSDTFAMSSDPFGSTALDMEQKQPTAFTDEAPDTEPDMSSWAAEADAEDRNHVALEQDPSMWAAEVSERRACVRDLLAVRLDMWCACRCAPDLSVSHGLQPNILIEPHFSAS